MSRRIRLLSLISLIFLTVTLAGCADTNTDTNKNPLKYTLNSSGEAVITGCNADATSLTVPSQIDGHPVISIGSGAFFNYVNLKEVIIEEGVKVIESSAFEHCTSLVSVTLPDSLESIGDSAFNTCTSLNEISLGEHSALKNVGKLAFYGCRALEFNEFDNAKYIPKAKNAYFILYEAKDKEITSCEINSMSEIIAAEAFTECIKLTELTVPENIKYIGDSAFKTCSKLGNIYFYAKIPDRTELNPIIEKVGSVSTPVTITIGKNLTEIPDYLFSSIYRLVNVVFEDGTLCTSIGEGAFYNCNFLSSVTLPASVENIGARAFEACENLQMISLDNSSLKFIGENAFYECDSLAGVDITDKKAFCECEYENKYSSPLSNGQAVIVYNGNATSNLLLPEGITKISANAFSGYKELNKIIIPKSVTVIEEGAFADCEGLSEIYYADSSSAFSALEIQSSNEAIIDAVIYYYSSTRPTVPGNFWCYINGVPGIWENNQ